MIIRIMVFIHRLHICFYQHAINHVTSSWLYHTFHIFDNKNPTVILVPEEEELWKGSLHLICKFCRLILYRRCHAFFHWNVLCNDLILLILCRNPQCRLVCHLVKRFKFLGGHIHVVYSIDRETKLIVFFQNK